MAQAPSSISGKLYFLHTFLISPIPVGLPNASTNITAFVFVVILLSNCSGVILNVSNDTSAKIGIAPISSTTLEVAGKEKSETITSSPALTLNSFNAIVSAVVAEVVK